MAIVVYKCDVCKREIELQRNITGLERVNRCTVTLGCRGKLYQTKNLPDYIRGNMPDEVSGLDDWQPRRVLYNHTQTIARDTWTIEHDLGTNPSISVFVKRPLENDLEHQEEITPTDVVIVDKNTLTLVFDRAWSGVAQLVARQTDPDLLHPVTTTAAVETVAYQRLTNSGEITIATTVALGDPEGNVYIDATFTNTIGVQYTKTFTVDSYPSIDSPWSDVGRVVVKGKVYKVRSFNLIIPEIIGGEVVSGSTIKLTNISFSGSPGGSQPIAAGQVLLLLASDPYTTFDKITNKFIDVADTTDISIFYDAPEFYSTTDVIQNTYPTIRSV